MKIVKIIQKYRKVSDDVVRSFIYKNMSQEMINGLEYDDPKVIARALKLLGIDHKDKEDHTKHGMDGNHDRA